MVYYFLIGICFGSFITCFSYRLPRGKSFVKGRSYCPSCKHSLGFWDLFPIISWIISLGKCRYCEKTISVRYPLIEITTGILFLFIHYIFHSNTQIELLMLYLVLIFIAIIIIDLEHYIIPDSLQLAVLFAAIIWSIYYEYSIFYILFNLSLGFLSSFLLAYFFKKIRKKEGLGFGDVKFIAIAAIFVGVHNLALFYLISGIIGVLHGLLWQKIMKKEIFPFAPSLVFSLFLCLIIPSIFAKSWMENLDLIDLIINSNL